MAATGRMRMPTPKTVRGDLPPIPTDLDPGKKPDAQLKRYETELASWLDAGEAPWLKADEAFASQVYEFTKASLDRARAAADIVQKASLAIAGIYTTILGIGFSVVERPLPSRGFIPVVFLGVSIFASLMYLAFVVRDESDDDRAGFGKWWELDNEEVRNRRFFQVAGFSELVSITVSRRALFLRVAVVYIALGVITLPSPFVNQVPFIASAVSTTSSAERVQWPATPAEVSDPELAKILYKAQVAEVAAARAASPKADTVNETPFYVVASILGIAGLAVAALPNIFKRRKKKVVETSSSPSDQQPGPAVHITADPG